MDDFIVQVHECGSSMDVGTEEPIANIRLDEKGWDDVLPVFPEHIESVHDDVLAAEDGKWPRPSEPANHAKPHRSSTAVPASHYPASRGTWQEWADGSRPAALHTPIQS
jgi:hypothetical protein